MPEFTADEKQELMSVANALADVARVETLKYFRSDNLDTDNKDQSGFDPVTKADRATELAMRKILEERRPEDSVLGEEFAPKHGKSGLTWVLDPIDGTRSYICGVPAWGVLIGLDAGAGPVFGMIDQPYLGERFIGAFGQASLTINSSTKSIKTRECKNLSDAILFTTFPKVGSNDERSGFEAVSQKVKLTRYGLDCYAYALLAMGQIDLIIEAGLKAYDVQGPQGVVEAAGGVMTNWKGEPSHMGGRILAAGDPELHAQALEILSRIPS